jgi:hypothetical protein
MIEDGLEKAAADLFATMGITGRYLLHPLMGGKNNRVFRVESEKSDYLLKAYFQHSNDQRDRLGAEYSFSMFAWENGVRCLAQPLACDTKNHLGVYAFVPGRQPLESDVTDTSVQQALSFFRDVNSHKESAGAMALSMASEACFSLEEHLRCVSNRVEYLKLIEEHAAIDHEATLFVRGQLKPAWAGLVASITKHVSEFQSAREATLCARDRCLSPSDFGFHNAIMQPDGEMCFIDFEYAGWDDPAKTVCDFFCQQAVPVPMTQFQTFAMSVVEGLAEPQRHLDRITLLLPVYKIKWCCILLNEFMPVGHARRRFAHPDRDRGERKLAQLAKAQKLLGSLSGAY